jgi:hypothetical protein
MDEELSKELIKELRGIKEEVSKQNEFLKNFSTEIIKELSGIKREISNL